MPIYKTMRGEVRCGAIFSVVHNPKTGTLFPGSGWDMARKAVGHPDCAPCCWSLIWP